MSTKCRTRMSNPDELAKSVMDAYAIFDSALHGSRRYPLREFRAFFKAAQTYAEASKKAPLIHRSVAGCINGLREDLEHERKRVPGEVLRDAERLEVLLFSGYDPYFEGDEPPGL